MKTIFAIRLPAAGRIRALAAAMICTGGETPAAAQGRAHTKRLDTW